jgi:hypothetical protein
MEGMAAVMYNVAIAGVLRQRGGGGGLLEIFKKKENEKTYNKKLKTKPKLNEIMKINNKN